MGRPPLTEEIRRFQIRQKAWSVTEEYISSSEPLKERAEIASRLVLKDMGDKVEHSGKVEGIAIVSYKDVPDR